MSFSTEKKSFWNNFNLSKRQSCANAIRNGGVAAMISAILTGIVSVMGLFITPSTQNLNYLFNPWMLIDFIIVTILGVFVFRRSRIASTILVIYFVIAKVDMWITLGKPTGLFTAIIIFYFYVNAMIGTYIWNSRFINTDVKNGPESETQPAQV